MYPGEPQFVLKPGAKDEDDGILLSTVTDVRNDHHDFLLILNAKTLKEICRAYVDCHIPKVMHGMFLNDKYYWLISLLFSCQYLYIYFF